jgi:hypothetical protein
MIRSLSLTISGKNISVILGRRIKNFADLEVLMRRRLGGVPPDHGVANGEELHAMQKTIGTLVAGAIAALAMFVFVGSERASAQEHFAVGSKPCEECHKAEVEVWSETVHFKSFREVHKVENARAIAEATGDRNMRRNPTCTICHYTLVAKEDGTGARARLGPSCESCHGKASTWIRIHRNFGGGDAKLENEEAAHRETRIAEATAAGMIWPAQRYDIAANCMTCHGLAAPELSGETLAQMLDAGHPINPDFELVKYSQGSVRHRFFRPTPNENKEMTPIELARLFVEGQAAKLVSAAGAVAKSENAKYVAAQEKRAADASAALGAVTSVAEAAALIADPTADNARALVAAIADKDLTGEVGGLLPDEADYK